MTLEMTVKKSRKKRVSDAELAAQVLDPPYASNKKSAKILAQTGPSKKLLKLIEKVPVVPIQKLQIWMREVFELGRLEGFEDMKIGKWVRKSMAEAGYSERWVRKILPDTAKEEQDRVTATEYDDDDEDDTVTNDAKEEESASSPTTVTEQQPEVEDEAPTGYYQIPLEEFKIEDVEQYDRLFLIKVVQHLYKENQELKKKK